MSEDDTFVSVRSDGYSTDSDTNIDHCDKQHNAPFMSTNLACASQTSSSLPAATNSELEDSTGQHIDTILNAEDDPTLIKTPGESLLDMYHDLIDNPDNCTDPLGLVDTLLIQEKLQVDLLLFNIDAPQGPNEDLQGGTQLGTPSK